MFQPNPFDATRETCDRLGRQLAQQVRRAELARARGDRTTPSPALIAQRTKAYCESRGLTWSTCWAAHNFAVIGLPFDTVRASIYRRAAIAAHRPR